MGYSNEQRWLFDDNNAVLLLMLPSEVPLVRLDAGQQELAAQKEKS
jgi:hypothetical protein